MKNKILFLFKMSAEDLNEQISMENHQFLLEAEDETLHELLTVNGINLIVLWLIVRELLQRHQFDNEDFKNLSVIESEWEDTSDEEADAFTKDFGDFNASNRRIIGSDLTEFDIYQIMNAFIYGDVFGPIDLWTSYVINDRMNRKKFIDFRENFMMMLFNNGEIHEFIRLANVNPMFTTLIYNVYVGTPEEHQKIAEKLHPALLEHFRPNPDIYIEKLPSGQKRWHPEVPRLKELSYLRFIDNLRL